MESYRPHFCSSFLFLGLFSLAVPAFAQATDPSWGSAWKKSIPDSSSFYDFVGKGESFTIQDGKREFNRGIKRDKTILVTGDKARFAMLCSLPMDTLDPDFQKFGDGRVQITYQGEKVWLDSTKGCKTTFYPGGTEYQWDSTTISGLKANLLVTQAENWGMVARLSLTNTSDQPLNVQADWVWGGVARITRTIRAEYFPPDRDDTPGDKISLGDTSATLHEEKLPYNASAITSETLQKNEKQLPFLCTVASYPAQKPALSNKRVVYSYNLSLEPNKTQSIYLVASHTDPKGGADKRVAQAEPEKLIAESKSYYEGIQSPYDIATPSAALNSGFWTGITNLDYEYTAPAWLEGVHWWATSFPNISQINAAMLLGQEERARKALEAFGLSKKADYVFFTTTGSPCGGGGLYDYDAYPYHLRDVMAFYDFTGDRNWLEPFWPRLMSATKTMWEKYAGSDNILLKFHMGCNCLMYQADDLGLPGMGASPSLFMAGMPEQQGKLAATLGKKDDAKMLKDRSSAMYKALLAKMWNPSAGCFYNHVDLQGVKHMTHYYSDFVWPTLYTSLDNKYGWQSLNALNHSLWMNPNSMEPALMRVGDLKPSMFGDDNVMPFQMAEAARAYYRIGDKERATRLLESVALGATVFTEAPGNFPERMLDNGRGDANYIFGPPTGAYVMGVIDGLFGLGIIDTGKTFAWRPGFPESWNNAHLKVAYAELTYESETLGAGRTDRYELKSSSPKGLKFSIFLPSSKIARVTENGQPVEYKLTPALDNMLLEFSAPAAPSHIVEIMRAPIALEVKGPKVIGVGMDVAWDLGTKIKKVTDPQKVLSGMKFEGNVVKGKVSKNVGWHQFFVELADVPIIKNMELEVRPRYEATAEKAVYDPAQKTLKIAVNVASPGDIPAGATVKLSLLRHEGSVKLDWTGSGETTKTVEMKNVPMLPEGAYAVKCAIMNGKQVVYKATNNVTLTGSDEAANAAIRKLRDERSHGVDLSKFYNTDTIRIQSYWNNGVNYVVDRTPYAKDGGLVKTGGGDFKIPTTGSYMAMVEYGSSDPATREIKKLDKPTSITVPVGKKALSLSLLYACEHESRNTFATLGRLCLKYKDGHQTEIPFVSAKNVDTVNGHFAKETIPLRVKIVDQDTWESSLDVLRIPCDPARVLESVMYEAQVADFEIGLIGANVIAPE